MTLHDLSPWLYPEWQPAARRVRTRTPWLLRFGCATMVIADSQAVRRQILDRFRLPPEQVISVPLAADARFHPIPVPLGEAAPPPLPYFLYAGTLEPRKNIPLLLDAWRVVRQDFDIDLVLAGRRRPDFPSLAPEPGLHVPGEVVDAELARLFSQTVAVVYPSAYEGFGLPVLEAMQCGAVVIASRDPAITEVSGGAAVPISSCRELIAAMRAAATDLPWAAEHRRRSLARARDFSWNQTARLTRDVYLEAIARYRRTRP